MPKTTLSVITALLLWGLDSIAIAQAQPVANAWKIELIVFAHPSDNDSWRDTPQLDDFRENPALAAIFDEQTPYNPDLNTPKPQTNTRFETNNEGLEPPPVNVMLEAWENLANNYDRIGYYRWEQRRGRGAWRRIIGQDELEFDTSLALGSHHQLDGKVQVLVANVGAANIQLQQRTPVNYFSNEPTDTPVENIWRIRKINENRPVEAGRVEYFDSPGLGVLLLISPPSQTSKDQTP